mmetsp:Transcript_21713/g.65088  ORF Transcript_21713/g.65088 Transcript_21713/m.65088 type:complete len:227 (+) Transcript_21713:205-885(+)
MSALTNYDKFNGIGDEEAAADEAAANRRPVVTRLDAGQTINVGKDGWSVAPAAPKPKPAAPKPKPAKKGGIDYSKWDNFGDSDSESDKEKESERLAEELREAAKEKVALMSKEQRDALGDQACPELMKVIQDVKAMGFPDPLGENGPFAVGGYFDSGKGHMFYDGSGGHYLDDLTVRLEAIKQGGAEQQWRGREAVAFLSLVRQGCVMKRKEVEKALEWGATFDGI